MRSSPMSSLALDALASLARQNTNQVEALILSNIHPNGDGLLEAVERYLEPLASTLPRELAQKFVDKCSELSHYGGFVISLALAHLLESISTEQADNRALYVALPRPCLHNAAARLSEGLTDLNVSGAYVDDTFLLALSKSGAAKTLKSLSARHSYISDASSAAWPSFASLESIEIAATEYIGEVTLKSISRLPEIRTLYAYTAAPFDAELLRTILAPTMLPNLVTFDVNIGNRDVDQKLDLLLDVLEKRPNLDLIEQIRLDVNWTFNDKVIRLHRLCPNLISAHWDGSANIRIDSEDSAEILSSFSNFKYATVCDIFENPTAEFVASRLPSLFPALENLEYEDAQPMTDFSMFSSLKKLTYSTSGFVNTKHWPGSLEQLRLNFRDDENPVSSAHVDEFFSTLATSTPNLEYFSFRAQPGMMFRRHAQLLLDSCHKLRILNIYLGMWDEAGDQPFVISHPNLIEFPNFQNVDHALPVAGNMPSLQNIWVLEPHERVMWLKVSPSCIPNVRSVDWTDFQTTQETAPHEMLRALAASSARLNQLNLSISPIDSNLIDILPSLNYLHTLHLIQGAVGCAAAQRLLSSLPWLNDFSVPINFDKNIVFDWIQHPRLSRLDLVMDVEDGAAPDSTKEFTVLFSPDRLPSIQRILLTNYIDANWTVKFQDLPCLYYINLDESLCNTCVEISGCHFLSTLYMVRPKLNKLTLKDMEHLGLLDLSYVLIGDDFEQSELPECLPFLHSFSLEVEKSDYSDQYQAFVERIKKASQYESRKFDWREEIIERDIEDQEDDEVIDTEDEPAVEAADLD